jgi:hypothetical protein
VSYDPNGNNEPFDRASWKMKIEAVTTCVDHADFLAHSLPINRQHFDKLIVVTSPEDKYTRRVCDHWQVRYKTTDAFRSRWGEFWKGAGVNEGLAELDKDAWMVHLDADTVLPAHFRQTIERADLDPSMIYGIDRAEFKSYEDWAAYHGDPEPQVQGGGLFVHTGHSGQTIGTRVMFKQHGGWIPIGFFQMWHAESGQLRYPEGGKNACAEDSDFAARWPRRKRGFIPEVIAWHLESEHAPMAVNWAGRKTKQFQVDGGFSVRHTNER